jgi:cardiolipin synthase A/B
MKRGLQILDWHRLVGRRQPRQPIRLKDGTLIQLYRDGEGLRAAYQAIRRAKKRICLEIYIFQSDETGRAFSKLLAEKARQGVHVYILYDFVGSSSSDRAMFEEMEAAGVKLKAFHPLDESFVRFRWPFLQRDHRKLLIVDNVIAGVGGVNLGAEYAGSWIVRVRSNVNQQGWRDSAIGLRGPFARQLTGIFAQMWQYAHRGAWKKTAELFHNVRQGELGILAIVPSPGQQLLSTMRELIRRSSSTVLITMAYFAPDEGFIDELCRAAKRGVRVCLVLPGKCDVRILMVAAKSFYEKLLAAGVEIYERQKVVLHAKVMCIDNHLSILGSTNLDYRSFRHNFELSLIVRSEEFAAQIHDQFVSDVSQSKQIALKEWKNRSRFSQMVEWLANRCRQIL